MYVCMCVCVCIGVCVCVCMYVCLHVCVYVVGSPLEIAQVVNPTEDQVDDIHQQYIDHLVLLFETHKSDYGISQEQHLSII